MKMAISPERYLISAVLRGHDMKTAMGHNVTGEMFHTHPDEWDWLEKYYAKYKRVPSKVAFKAQFPRFTVQQVDDIGHFADEVRKAHARQLMLEMMQDAADCLADGDIDTAVKKANSSIIQIAASMGTNMDGDIFTDFHDILQDVESRVRRVKEQGSSGIATGFPSIDDRTGGYNPGELWIIGARLGVGKSWVMQNSAAVAACMGYGVQFDALEMSRAQVGMRVQALVAGHQGYEVFSNTALMQGKNVSMSDYKDFLRKLKQSIAGRLHVSDTSRGRVSVTTIASQIERNKPDIVFIDYLTLMQKSGPDWQGVAELSGDLKATAMNYQIPIVAAAQLNRENGLGKGDPPGPEALAQSDAIGQDADAVVTMRKMSPSVLAFRMAKYRNGPSDFKWYAEFAPDKGRIKEVSYNDALKLQDEDKDREDEEASK